MVDDEIAFIARMEANGYRHVRKLASGEWAGVRQVLFATWLFLGLDETGSRTRFCFSRWREAVESLEAWDGVGFPPGWWIKQKPENAPNPRAPHAFMRPRG